jgi:predicted metal-dependent phosphoesterase TrpH
LIDLHLHTTASDGRCTPRQLVERAVVGCLSVMAVTDHDTVAGIAEVQEHARAAGIEVVPGIEITAIERGADIHMLAYFVDPANAALATFLEGQRASRLGRIAAIAARLEELGKPGVLGSLLADAEKSGRSVGRPQIARAMIAAGYVADMREAFDNWLGHHAPAFVSRTGPAPEQVLDAVHRSHGLVSLAHPGRTKIDVRIPDLVAAGLDAIEVYHSDHDASALRRYRDLSRRLDILVTGGSDFHGDPARGISPGSTTLPAGEWKKLSAARDRHA